MPHHLLRTALLTLAFQAGSAYAQATPAPTRDDAAHAEGTTFPKGTAPVGVTRVPRKASAPGVAVAPTKTFRPRRQRRPTDERTKPDGCYDTGPMGRTTTPAPPLAAKPAAPPLIPTTKSPM